MKKNFFVGMLALIIAILPSCHQSSLHESNVNKVKNCNKKNKSSLRATEGRAILAELIANSIKSEDVANEISLKASSERDGDREFLLDEIIQGKDNLRSSSVIYNSLEKSFNEIESLRSSNNKASLAEFKSFEEFARHLMSIDPLIQIAIVSKSEDTPVIDLKKDDVLTVYLPEDCDDQKEIKLTAYDKAGNTIILDSREEPDVPVIVIGDNERLLSVAKGTSVAGNLNYGDLYFKGSVKDYYYRSDLIVDVPLHPVPRPVIIKKTYERDQYPDYKEHLEKARFTSQSAMRKFEPWFLGRPEMKYTIIPINKPEIKISGECTSKGWKKGAIKPLDIRLFNWDKNEFGEYYLVHWTEIDGGAIKEITPKVTGNLFGLKIETTFKIDLGSGDDEVGGTLVCYRDKALEGERYDIGNMFQFWIKIL